MSQISHVEVIATMADSGLRVKIAGEDVEAIQNFIAKMNTGTPNTASTVAIRDMSVVSEGDTVVVMRDGAGHFSRLEQGMRGRVICKDDRNIVVEIELEDHPCDFVFTHGEVIDGDLEKALL